jgi:hypothetical protein
VRGTSCTADDGRHLLARDNDTTIVVYRTTPNGCNSRNNGTAAPEVAVDDQDEKNERVRQFVLIFVVATNDDDDDGCQPRRRIKSQLRRLVIKTNFADQHRGSCPQWDRMLRVD